MTLKLSFFKEEDSRAPYQTASFEIGSAGGTLRTLVCNLPKSNGRFHDCTYVEACVCGADNPKGRYRLQLAYKPDYEPVADKDGDFIDKEQLRLQLLRGACGTSLMRLLNRGSTASEWEEKFTFKIEVEPAREKKSLLEAMVDELIEDDCPHEVLSRFEGLSQTRIERKWVRGDVSSGWWSALIKYEEMKKLYTCISPRLKVLSRNYSASLIRVFEPMKVANLRRMPRITLCDMGKKGATHSCGRKVLGSVVRETGDILIHKAIKDFLIRFKSELSELLVVIEESLLVDRQELSILRARDEMWRSQNKRPMNQWAVEDKSNEVAVKNQIAIDIRRMIDGCVAFLLGPYPWVHCNPLPIVNVPIMYVPDSVHYRYLYARMLQFAQKRFLWSSIRGRFFVPKYIRYDEGEPSTWQKNYSYIYEAWVFKRLVDAFSAEGFGEISERYHEKARQMLRRLQLGPVTNEPVHAEMTNGTIRIDIFHGLRAYKSETGDRWMEFTSIGGPLLTPDFAIIFTNPGGVGAQSFHWIVLDAKSGWEIREDAVRKRDTYLAKFLRYEEPPDQSWLVYSGAYGGNAGVEFDEVNDSYLTWNEERGIEGWSDRRVNARGHLRVNCHTIKTFDAFRAFAKGEIATAKQRLGLAQ